VKIIFKIAKTELRTLFYSPVAWFLMIAFFVQCGYAYTYLLDSNARAQELGGFGLQYMTDLTVRIFGGREGLFASVMQKLYLYIPLLTMGLISREINNGTIKLLYTSPIKVWQIVLGKYTAMMIFSLVLVAIIGVFLVLGAFNIRHADYGILFSAALGFYLLLCAYSAIGLFMSCLTTHQVVAAVSTFIMIGCLSYVGQLWQGIDFVRDITYFLAMTGRTAHMLFGLITTDDVIYFIVIVYIFLGLTIYKMKGERESKPAMVKAGRYVMVIASALAVGYISSRPGFIGYLDVTANKSKTLTPTTQKILADLGDEPLEITTYSNLLGNNAYFGLPEGRNYDLERWEPYLRFKTNISLKYVNYYDSVMEYSKHFYSQYPGKNLKEMAEMMAKNYDVDIDLFKTPEEIHQIIDLKPELNRYVMHVRYKDKSTFLRIFNDNMVFPSETEVSAALKRLMSAQLPKVAFLTGDLERSIIKQGERHYYALTAMVSFRNALVNQGFDVDTLSLKSRDIPAGITTLVIADPKVDLAPDALAKIYKYIDQGGNLLIMAEPSRHSPLNPILEKLGVRLTEGVVVQPNPDDSPDIVLPSLTTEAMSFSKSLAKSYSDSMKTSMPGVTGLAYADSGTFTIKPLLVTDAKTSWIKTTRLVVDSADVVYEPGKGDRKVSVPTAISMTRQVNGKEQRIVVTADADVMSTRELTKYRYANFAFNTAVFSWLDYGRFPIDTSRPEPKDKRVNVTTAQVAAIKTASVWVVPGILLAAGTVLLIRRKRK